jgi:hypothetical protein
LVWDEEADYEEMKITYGLKKSAQALDRSSCRHENRVRHVFAGEEGMAKSSMAQKLEGERLDALCQKRDEGKVDSGEETKPWWKT